jgi:hypothetical protein
MARKGRAKRTPEPLPPPLPPQTRTVGQLVAETVRLYGSRFWPSLALGVPIALVDEAVFGRSIDASTVILWASAPLFAIAYACASALVDGRRPPRRTFLLAVALGIFVFLPFPALVRFFVLPGVAWLAYAGLCVPALVIERLGFREAISRGIQLGRADYVHALGSLATLAIVYALTRYALLFTLHSAGETTQRTAGFLADLVVSPILILGGALLYVDQAARVVDSAPRRRRRRDADLHPALDADAAGRPDAQGEP